MAKSKLSVVGFPAKTSLRPGSRKASKPQGQAFGQNTIVLLARYNRCTQLWKMFGTFSLGKVANGSRKSLATWPRSGTMRNGTVYRLPTLAPHTSGTAYGLLPTPLAGDAIALQRTSRRSLAPLRRALVAGSQPFVVYYLLAANYSALEMVTFVESMMGFPKNWTASEPSEML